MMKIKNKFEEDSKMTQNDQENSKEIEHNSSFLQNNSAKEKIIKDLKQLGCNESQIDGIFETFIRNSIGEESLILDDKKSEITKKSEMNESDLPSSARLGKNITKNITKKNGYISMKSKYKNSFIYKAEIFREKNNKNKSKQNCAKLYINASSEKNRIHIKNSKENEKSNSKKFKNTTFIPNSTSNNSYTRKNNQKIGSYLRKFGSYYNNNLNMNKIEQNRKDLERKLENELNNKFKNKKKPLYNNYNFKMIFDSKKKIDNMDNSEFTEVDSSSLREKEETDFLINKSRNSKESNRSIYTNLFNKKRNLVSSHTHISYDLKEIKEEKENNENNKDIEIKENNENINKADFKNFYTNYSRKNNENNEECKINSNLNRNKFSEDTLSNNTKLIVSKKVLYEDYKFPSKNRKNIFMIRKQKSEEEENLAKKNTAIIEIKHNENNPYRNVEFLKYEKSNKSKSLSKLLIKGNESNNYDSRRNLSNYNHSFVNINLCKKKSNNNSTYYKLRDPSIRENSCSKLDNNIQNDLNINFQSSFEELSITKEDILYNRINKINNSEISNYNKRTNALINHHNSNYYIKKYNSNINFNKYNSISNSMSKSNINQNNSGTSMNLDSYQNKNKINNNRNNINLRYYRSQKKFNKTTEDNQKQIKEYENGLYEGVIIDGKREHNGVMIYKNGAKYEGEWKNDKKNGKGVFTSPHYYNCRKNVGMKYEGEFKDDKFEGYGITTYTNGDKYEGEWKNSKQYGKGTVSYFDGSKYSGEWKDGNFNGIGVFYLKNGEKYEGRFVNNKYNGYGKYYYINGNYLEGIFRNDQPKGNCLLHKNDGSVVNVHH